MIGGKYPQRRVNKRTVQFGIVALVGMTLFLIYQLGISQTITPDQPQSYTYRGPHLNVAIACCGNRLQEAMVLIKSIALFAGTPVFLHIFVENDLQNQLKSQIKAFPEKYLARIPFQIYDIQYPLPTEAERTKWKNLFRKCASQRLFMPAILKNVDSVLYFDTDTLLLGQLGPIFAVMTTFNSSHAVALVPEQEPGDLPSWYTVHTSPNKPPFYGKQGLNSGVMLMNLTRLRALPWIERLQKYYSEYQTNLGDQDLLNIYFHFHPDEVYLLTCEWNFRSDYCYQGRNVCNRSESFGVRVLHGNNMVWHTNGNPTFKAVYNTVEKHNMNEPVQPVFGKSMLRHLSESVSARGRCLSLSSLFVQTAISLSDKITDEY